MVYFIVENFSTGNIQKKNSNLYVMLSLVGAIDSMLLDKTGISI